MDNTKTGQLIRQRRTQLGLTQKELAEKLNITDKAVSKWERGLSAPDIALLEPLGLALGLSVTELISGEAGAREDVKRVIEYSVEEISTKTRRLKKKHLISAAAIMLAFALTLGIWLWQSHVLSIIERLPSPDGKIMLTVYDCDITGDTDGDATSITESGARESRAIYGGAYGGLWWAPDSSKYVVSIIWPGEGEMLLLNDLKNNHERNLDAYLSMGVEYTELKKYGFISQGIWPEIDYEFLQWSRDSSAILIYYSFEDEQGTAHSGYFWYDLGTGSISGILELEDKG